MSEETKGEAKDKEKRRHKSSLALLGAIGGGFLCVTVAQRMFEAVERSMGLTLGVLLAGAVAGGVGAWLALNRVRD